VPRQPIQQLPISLVNRIAAGEVIERPASVVKELVENSLDAGATHILVEIEDGGRELIRIIDDGGGIPAAELPLAFAEHATSKLTSDDDLFRIATMGFRGEALASIGSVSHARILSRTADGDAAYEITNEGGKVSDVQAAAGNVGTTVQIRHLFFNTPARRKFLKGASTEFGHISDMLLRLALPYPQVSFKLLHNGRTSLDLPATTEADRLLAAWPDEFHEKQLTITARDAEMNIRGIVGPPDFARPTGKYQFFYLNGRHVRDRFMQHASREAFRGLIEPGRYPACVLLLTVPPSDVDVNVHPTKVEVRFKDSGRIHGLVMSAIRERLLQSDLTPPAVPFRADVSVPSPMQQGLREKLADFFRGGVSSGESVTPSGGADVANAQATHIPLPQSVVPPPSAPLLMQAPALAPAATVSTGKSSAIQLHNSYLVAETSDGMIIIDQHALHERVMYEELRERLLRGPLESQRLLIPATVTVSSRQMALLDPLQPLLQRLGMEISIFGPTTLAVQAFPSFLSKLDPADFLHELLERGEQELLDLHEEEILHEILDMMACKAAVKAGDPLTPAEIEALLEKRHLIDRSSNCPHGRPTTLRLTLHDLEKQFKRTGF
jgi:DNA mismatch repair protein MutL